MKARVTLCLVAMMLSGLASAKPRPVAKFSRSCYVFFEPFNDAKKMCLKRAGHEVVWASPLERGWVQIETEDCNGFVADACLTDGGFDSRRTIVEDPDLRSEHVRLIPYGHFSGQLGGVNSDSVHGSGYGGGLRVQISLPKRFRISLMPSYEVVGLTRAIDTSGAVADPNPAEFTQTVRYFGIAAMGEYVILRHYKDNRPTIDPEISLDLGFQYLFPSSAKQTDTTGGSFEFKPTDKPLLLLLGGTLDFGLTSHFSMLGTLHFFYNVAGTGGSSFYGGRLGFALAFAL